MPNKNIIATIEDAVIYLEKEEADTILDKSNTSKFQTC